MDSHRRHKSNSSGDNFTFPTMSPDLETDTELADHLFSNGKFLLHTFPLQPKSFSTCAFSRTYSVGSKDSLVSSRSNSTNSSTSSNSSSSSSGCNSARTSISEASPRVAIKTNIFPEKGSWSPGHYTNSYYMPAQRWQFMATVPVLNRPTSQKRKGGDEKRKRSPENKKISKKKGFCRRFFRWVVSTCKECHAMEPSKKVV